eukprot:3047049-Amphidinium_carterae.1
MEIVLSGSTKVPPRSNAQLHLGKLRMFAYGPRLQTFVKIKLDPPLLYDFKDSPRRVCVNC